MRRLGAVGVCVSAVLLLGACASSPPESGETPGAVASPEPVEPTPTSDAAALSGDEIQEWIANAEWSFAPQGLLEPVSLSFTDGAASDDLSRTYEIGVGVEGDANADGVADLAVPVAQLDGNGFLELWYIWLGSEAEAEADGEAVAEQVVYPIARTARCGDTVHAVAPIDGGFRVDETLWMPHTDEGRDCAAGGTGTQIRDITVTVIDGTPFPIQTAPVDGWGGVCPRSDWLDGIPDDTVEGRAAPPASAPQIISAGENVVLYELPEATLLTSGGARFFGFQPEALQFGTQEEADAVPVRMHCAFAGTGE